MKLFFNDGIVVLPDDNKSSRKELSIAKRRLPYKKEFLTGHKAESHINFINRLVYFYRYFETRIAINKGDVFLIDFGHGVGNELSDPHFVVAITDSTTSNQMVTVVPLHSVKKDREINPSSEIYIGEVEGLNNGKEAIATISQARTIDKRRLFDKEKVLTFNQYAQNNDLDYKEIVAQHKLFYRLNNEQMSKIIKAVVTYYTYGFIAQRK